MWVTSIRTLAAGLRHISLILIGIGVVVLLMTVLDRQLARADREPGHDGRTARGC